MNKKNTSSRLGRLLAKIAPKIGAKILFESEWNIAGQITFKNGKRSYFKYGALDLNSQGSSKIAKDKDYSNFFMKSMGYNIVPDSKTFYSDEWGKKIGAIDRDIHFGYEYAEKLGFPVIVKPNSRSQGIGVALVHNKEEFYNAVNSIFKIDKIALIQRPVKGKDYRIVVLDNEIISAYERIPLNIIGDGISTIEKLLGIKQKQFLDSKRDTKIKIQDPRIEIKLRNQSLDFKSIPAMGQKVFLLDNANLSTGGDSVDMTKYIHTEFKKLAIKLTADMGLRLCGVDLMVQGDISKTPDKYWILEINSAPGLDHYAKIGKEQEQIVEDLYLQVLKHMEE